MYKHLSHRFRITAAAAALSVAVSGGMAITAPAEASVATLSNTYTEATAISQYCNASQQKVFGLGTAIGPLGQYVRIKVHLWKQSSSGKFDAYRGSTTWATKQIVQLGPDLFAASRSYSATWVGSGKFVAQVEVQRWRGSSWSLSEYNHRSNWLGPLYCHF